MTTIRLPNADRTLSDYTLSPPGDFGVVPGTELPRVAYSAAHVVADPMADVDPWLEPALDWEATIRYRHYLWDLGLGVAEAMDTAQRGMGLDWPATRDLIRHVLDAAKGRSDSLIASGCGTDHLDPDPNLSVDDIIKAYEEQMDFIEGLGGKLIIMASRALTACAKSPDDYATVYDRILSQAREPVLIHWLGEMFDPALEGYWGYSDHYAGMEVCLDILKDNANKVDGIKISLLDKDKEIAMRRRLPDGMKMYTGDDFNYPELIAGDEQGYSHALLGIFDAIAPAASASLQALGRGDLDRFNKILEPTVPLSRHIFKAPTRFYKTGVVFMAYLNGHQDHFVLVGGQESCRSLPHLAELFRLADKAGLLRDPELAVGRMRAVLKLHGLEG